VIGRGMRWSPTGVATAVATPTERTIGYEQEPDDHRVSEPLDMDEDGVAETTIAQDAVGAENVLGGGEFPDPDTPPQAPAPGAVHRDVENDERD
jgi:hypothetical protein